MGKEYDYQWEQDADAARRRKIIFWIVAAIIFIIASFYFAGLARSQEKLFFEDWQQGEDEDVIRFDGFIQRIYRNNSSLNKIKVVVVLIIKVKIKEEIEEKIIGYSYLDGGRLMYYVLADDGTYENITKENVQKQMFMNR